jgi:hypothetical protein
MVAPNIVVTLAAMPNTTKVIVLTTIATTLATNSYP